MPSFLALIKNLVTLQTHECGESGERYRDDKEKKINRIHTETSSMTTLRAGEQIIATYGGQ